MNKITRRETIQTGTSLMLTALLSRSMEAGSLRAAYAAGTSPQCVALTSDSVLLAVPLSGKGVGIFDYATAKKLRTLELPAEIKVHALAFVGSGSRLAALQVAVWTK